MTMNTSMMARCLHAYALLNNRPHPATHTAIDASVPAEPSATPATTNAQPLQLQGGVSYHSAILHRTCLLWASATMQRPGNLQHDKSPVLL
eukprot:CAMPEP_0202906528 /NCGR_PEP_ID=MMETSP1392-20130828/39295_1 /ASSEMBLY_ACC=CAM_ASM_000868 /TAXON_ID=225041 /ORGANISM="Chlamydomonas chlamydogama, Strain SAG 11-48b" /LENGTH=90 /DNA_ID=CAMNT_0049595081 /DNA_START=46 /DNA_END=315 /DNA_ORIENTATION=+